MIFLGGGQSYLTLPYLALCEVLLSKIYRGVLLSKTGYGKV